MRPATRLGAAAVRRALRTPLGGRPPHGIIAGASTVRNAAAMRSFRAAAGLRSLMPDAENPLPKESEPIDEPKVATDITPEEFHERADHYLNELVQRLEEAQEKDPAVEVDYSVCTEAPPMHPR